MNQMHLSQTMVNSPVRSGLLLVVCPVLTFCASFLVLVNLYLEHYQLAAVEALLALVAGATYLRLKRGVFVDLETSILAALYTSVILYALFSTQIGSWIALWLYTLPVLYHVLFNRYLGSFFTGVLLLVALGLFYSTNSYVWGLKHLNFIMPYMVVWIISFRHESLRIHTESQLSLLAQTDPLTSVGNRTALNLYWEAQGSEEETYLLYFDIDNFKSINDQYGHGVGDDVIRYIASERHYRHADGKIFRIGGEEFCWIFRTNNLITAVEAANDARIDIRDKVFYENGKVFSVTISAGLSRLDKKNNSLEETLTEADKALYQAKRNGKDQVRLVEALTKMTFKPSVYSY